MSGGEDDPDAAALRARAARLTAAPVLVPAADGIAIVGDSPAASAVHRALALQLCLALPPGELRIVGALKGENSWAERLPHRLAASGRRLALVGPGETVPPDADILIVQQAPGAPHPPRCGVTVTVESPLRVRVDHAGDVSVVEAEGIGREQATQLAEELAARAERSLGLSAAPESPIALDEILAAAPVAQPGRLAAVIGREGGEPAVIDLVADGPHAVVAGVTGSGKSELLITWILALCATHSTREVSFLLADFKGGTAFDALAGVPHVTGVITDLDGAGARRAIESLRAEVRWREAAIAGAGARDILDPRVELPRLVVVVDEFAALLGDHPELHAVFSDVAARGRALGVHLILGTQRAAGVIRDGLLANCPLRISLRVTDPADSRAVIGTDEAATLPGTGEGRGLALLRRASDGAPRRVRIALSDPRDVAKVISGANGPHPGGPGCPRFRNGSSSMSCSRVPRTAPSSSASPTSRTANGSEPWGSASPTAGCSSSADRGQASPTHSPPSRPRHQRGSSGFQPRRKARGMPWQASSSGRLLRAPWWSSTTSTPSPHGCRTTTAMSSSSAWSASSAGRGSPASSSSPPPSAWPESRRVSPSSSHGALCSRQRRVPTTSPRAGIRPTSHRARLLGVRGWRAWQSSSRWCRERR